MLSAIKFDIAVDRPDSCLHRICASFGDLPTSTQEAVAKIRFPSGWCLLQANGSRLTVTIEAENAAELNKIAVIIEMRVKRISKRNKLASLSQRPNSN